MAKTKQILISFCAGLCAGALILGAVVCKQSAAYSMLKSNYSDLKKVTAADKGISDKRIKEQESIIAEKDKRIQQILAGANQPTADEIAKDKKISDLNKKLASATADAERVPILTALVDSWMEKYNASEARRIRELNELNSEWSEKFTAQVKITDEWKSQYEREHSLRLHCELVLGVSERRLKIANGWAFVGKLSVIGVGGYEAYDKIFKKIFKKK